MSDFSNSLSKKKVNTFSSNSGSESARKYHEGNFTESSISFQRKKPQKDPDWKTALLTVWDGLGFFSFDLKKVPRIKPKKIRFMDKFTDMEDTPVMIAFFALSVWLLWGTVKSYLYSHVKSTEINL